MKLVVIGGHSRSIGKTSLMAGVIAASHERKWTAIKVTQYGHGICSDHGDECSCAMEDPNCSYAVTREDDPNSGTDTSRFLEAGAEDVYWVRTRLGQLDKALPEMRRLLSKREFVIVESNSILRFFNPDVYLPVLHFQVEDFKLSSKLYLNRADAYAVVGTPPKKTGWRGVDLETLERKPFFRIAPPGYFSSSVMRFISERLT
ncbi:MAG: hypothetical protein CMN58_03510 [Solibacterales bacterium]|nr:hypothetical protein [Bryobacterales bacterium]|tara:strand:- start:16825 stop:17433 length:609 start_codon:yes stop_codon:yes gene_type:complete